jgi:RHS repeat-associated protein
VERTEKQNKTEFVWDANGRLVESVSGGKKTVYQYDPLGRRISKETDGVTTRFYWDGDALLGDVTGDDTREWVYYPGSFEPLVMIRNEEFYLYHNDPNGCPTRLLDESGKVVWAARYDALGKVKKLLVDEVEQPLRLQGQYFDRETGLYYNRFRYYEPHIGSFISQDPLGLAAGENVYGFGPNTQTWIDPLGLCKKGPQTWNEFQKATAGQFGSRTEASVAWKVYKESKYAKNTLVIGRLSDTAAAELAGFQRLNTDGWTLAVNDSWIQGAIDGNHPLKLVSPINRSTMFNPPGSRFPDTIFRRELKQLKRAGYTIKGGWAIPPGGLIL